MKYGILNIGGQLNIKKLYKMYYPKSQIKTNLSTNQQNYKGHYYKTSTGDKYTGRFPNDGDNILLVELIPSSDEPGENNPILTLSLPQYSSNTTLERFLPLFNQTTPTQQDYTLGSFPRYFCKKTNELKYIEINKETHDKLKIKDSQIAWDLYEPQLIVWQISGDKEKTFLANKNNIALLEKRQKWYGFSQYLKEDYLKYYLAS
jgi:hypothetical protein